MTYLLMAGYIVVGVVVLALALPKWREVFWRRRETGDAVWLGLVSFLTVLGWPVVAAGWSLATVGRWLGGDRG